MSLKLLFEGQAVKSEMVVLMLEKWDLHPQMEEVLPKPDLNDLARDILWGESEIERAGF